MYICIFVLIAFCSMAWCIDLEALDEAVSPRDRLISISVAPCQHFLFYAGSVAVLAVALR